MAAETVETVHNKIEFHLTEALRWQLKLRELQSNQPPSGADDKTIKNLLNSIAEIKKSIEDLASKASATSNEISKLQQGQVDTVDVIGIMHEIVHDVAEVTLRDISAHKYKPTGSSRSAATQAPPASPPRRPSAPSPRASPAGATTSHGMTNGSVARDNTARMTRALSTVEEKEEDEASSFDSLLQNFRSSPKASPRPSPRPSPARRAPSPSDSVSLDSTQDSIYLSLKHLERDMRERRRAEMSRQLAFEVPASSASHRHSPSLPTLLFNSLPPRADSSLLRPTPINRFTPTPEPRTTPPRPLRVVPVSRAPEPVRAINVKVTRRSPSAPEPSRPPKRRTPAVAAPARAPSRGPSTTTRRAAPTPQPSRPTTRGPAPAPRTAAPSTSTRRKTSKAPGYLAHTANSMLRTANFPFDAQSALATKRGPRGTRK